MGEAESHKERAAREREAARIESAKTFYEVLGIDKAASKDEIKKAYRKLSRVVHPDYFVTDEKRARAAFQKLSNAYETLIDPDKRAEYDKPLPGGSADIFGPTPEQQNHLTRVFQIIQERDNDALLVWAEQCNKYAVSEELRAEYANAAFKTALINKAAQGRDVFVAFVKKWSKWNLAVYFKDSEVARAISDAGIQIDDDGNIKGADSLRYSAEQKSALDEIDTIVVSGKPTDLSSWFKRCRELKIPDGDIFDLYEAAFKKALLIIVATEGTHGLEEFKTTWASAIDLNQFLADPAVEVAVQRAIESEERARAALGVDVDASTTGVSAAPGPDAAPPSPDTTAKPAKFEWHENSPSGSEFVVVAGKPWGAYEKRKGRFYTYDEKNNANKFPKVPKEGLEVEVHKGALKTKITPDLTVASDFSSTTIEYEGGFAKIVFTGNPTEDTIEAERTIKGTVQKIKINNPKVLGQVMQDFIAEVRKVAHTIVLDTAPATPPAPPAAGPGPASTVGGGGVDRKDTRKSGVELKVAGDYVLGQYIESSGAIHIDKEAIQENFSMKWKIQDGVERLPVPRCAVANDLATFIFDKDGHIKLEISEDDRDPKQLLFILSVGKETDELVAQKPDTTAQLVLVLKAIEQSFTDFVTPERIATLTPAAPKKPDVKIPPKEPSLSAAELEQLQDGLTYNASAGTLRHVSGLVLNLTSAEVGKPTFNNKLFTFAYPDAPGAAATGKNMFQLRRTPSRKIKGKEVGDQLQIHWSPADVAAKNRDNTIVVTIKSDNDFRREVGFFTEHAAPAIASGKTAEEVLEMYRAYKESLRDKGRSDTTRATDTAELEPQEHERLEALCSFDEANNSITWGEKTVPLTIENEPLGSIPCHFDPALWLGTYEYGGGAPQYFFRLRSVKAKSDRTRGRGSDSVLDDSDGAFVVEFRVNLNGRSDTKILKNGADFERFLNAFKQAVAKDIQAGSSTQERSEARTAEERSAAPRRFEETAVVMGELPTPINGTDFVAAYGKIAEDFYIQRKIPVPKREALERLTNSQELILRKLTSFAVDRLAREPETWLILPEVSLNVPGERESAVAFTLYLINQAGLEVAEKRNVGTGGRVEIGALKVRRKSVVK